MKEILLFTSLCHHNLSYTASFLAKKIQISVKINVAELIVEERYRF